MLWKLPIGFKNRPKTGKRLVLNVPIKAHYILFVRGPKLTFYIVILPEDQKKLIVETVSTHENYRAYTKKMDMDNTISYGKGIYLTLTISIMTQITTPIDTVMRSCLILVYRNYVIVLRQVRYRKDYVGQCNRKSPEVCIWCVRSTISLRSICKINRSTKWSRSFREEIVDSRWLSEDFGKILFGLFFVFRPS